MDFDKLYNKIIDSIEAHVKQGGKIAQDWGFKKEENGYWTRSTKCCPLTTLLPNKVLDTTFFEQNLTIVFICQQLDWSIENANSFVQGFDSCYEIKSKNEYVNLGLKVQNYCEKNNLF